MFTIEDVRNAAKVSVKTGFLFELARRVSTNLDEPVILDYTLNEINGGYYVEVGSSQSKQIALNTNEPLYSDYNLNVISGIGLFVIGVSNS